MNDLHLETVFSLGKVVWELLLHYVKNYVIDQFHVSKKSTPTASLTLAMKSVSFLFFLQEFEKFRFYPHM